MEDFQFDYCNILQIGWNHSQKMMNILKHHCEMKHWACIQASSHSVHNM